MRDKAAGDRGDGRPNMLRYRSFSFELVVGVLRNKEAHPDLVSKPYYKEEVKDMKTKKMILVMAAVCSMVALFGVSAHAGWNLCTVTQTGAGWGSCYIRMTQEPCDLNQDPPFTTKWFIPRSDSLNEMLATALTARSNNEQVWMYSDMSGTYPELKALYLGAPPTP